MRDAGITRAGEGLDGIAWAIMGQTYKPVQRSESSIAFDTLFPPGTFVPPHAHPEQDGDGGARRHRPRLRAACRLHTA